MTLPDSCHGVTLTEPAPAQSRGAKNAAISRRAAAARSNDKHAQVGKENTNKDTRILLEEIFYEGQLPTFGSL